MFTMPQERFLADFEKRPGEVKGDLYDLVCNGVELASGSIRIHDPELQKRIFRFLGISDEQAQKRFGFLLEAFRYGPPPHGGHRAGVRPAGGHDGRGVHDPRGHRVPEEHPRPVSHGRLALGGGPEAARGAAHPDRGKEGLRAGALVAP